MFWCQASLLNHHALEVPRRPGVTVHGHACLTWGVGQLLGPLQSLHQVWVRSLGCIASWIWVWLARVRGSVAISTGLRHHVGWRNAALLHPRVHGPGIVHEPRHHVCSRGRRVVLRWLGTTAAGSSIMAVEVQELFRAFRSLRALCTSRPCWAATAAAASTGLLPALTPPHLWASRARPYFRHRARGHQTSTTGAFRA